MRFLFQLNHPAHYHLFKHAMNRLRAKGHAIVVVARDKDILLDLVDDQEVINIAPAYRKNGFFSVARDLIDRDRRVYEVARRWRPDLMIGTAIEISHAGQLLGIPSMFFGEDDARVVWLGSLINKPFCTHVVSPDACDNWLWNSKTIFYRGFQKLAYLHPRYFQPDQTRVQSLGESYYLLRLSALAAHHDRGRHGLSPTVLGRLIRRMREHGNVYITSEKPLPPALEALRLPTAVHDIHHVLYFSKLFIGDSQSMAMEAAMLGVPNVRVSDFAGRIGVLNEVEKRHHLSIGFRPDEAELVESAVADLIDNPTVRVEWESRRQRMLAVKISVTDFIVWLLDGYPETIEVVHESPAYQLRFQYDSNFSADVSSA